MMLDLNHHDKRGVVTRLIDTVLEAEAAEKAAKRSDEGTHRTSGGRIGQTCLRCIQFEYFKTPQDKPLTGKTARIFKRGHIFEDMMADWIKQAGLTLLTSKPDGGQFGFSVAKGRIVGFVDGIITGGPAEAGPYNRLWENKAVGSKTWGKLHKNGLKEASPIYFGQVQIYMAYMNLDENPALFTAINCDSMEIYEESVPFNGQVAQELSDKAVQVIGACEAGELLPRVSNDPSWYECRFCNFSKRCHHE